MSTNQSTEDWLFEEDRLDPLAKCAKCICSSCQLNNNMVGKSCGYCCTLQGYARDTPITFCVEYIKQMASCVGCECSTCTLQKTSIFCQKMCQTCSTDGYCLHSVQPGSVHCSGYTPTGQHATTY